jgi:hypothetical protein
MAVFLYNIFFSIEMDIAEMICDGMNQIELAQDELH